MAGVTGPILRMIAVAIVAASVAACNSDNPANYDYRLRHPLVVQRAETVVSVSASSDGSQLRSDDILRLRDFAQGFLESGEGKVEIVLWGNKGDSRTRDFAAALVASLAQSGLGTEQIQVRNVDAEGQVTSLLRFSGYVVRLPDCGRGRSDENPGFLNADSSNFGCAQQRNIGLMIANPRDLIRMRDGDSGRDGNRSVDVINKYRLGQPTERAPSDRSITVSPAGKPAAK